MTSLLRTSKSYRSLVKRLNLRIPKRMLRSDVLGQAGYCRAIGCLCNKTGIDTFLSFTYFHGQERSANKNSLYLEFRII